MFRMFGKKDDDPMPQDDSIWRALVNSYNSVDTGSDPPEMEMFKKTFAVPDEEALAAMQEELEEDELFVQKVVTEVYIFTDANRQVFGEHTFQDMVVLGVMTREKLVRLLNRQRRKREKGS